MTDQSNMIRAAIVAFLTKQDGAGFTLASLSSKIGLGLASVRKSLATLEEQGTVRRSTGERHARFYIPNATQRVALNKVIERKDVPLKPRPHHAERIAQIRAQREAFPSKYSE